MVNQEKTNALKIQIEDIKNKIQKAQAVFAEINYDMTSDKFIKDEDFDEIYDGMQSLKALLKEIGSLSEKTLSDLKNGYTE